jgi:hypothetical protein
MLPGSQILHFQRNKTGAVLVILRRDDGEEVTDPRIIGIGTANPSLRLTQEQSSAGGSRISPTVGSCNGVARGRQGTPSEKR